jgi:hypothetical protein
MNSRFFSFAMFCTASPTADTGTSRITSTWSTSYHRRAMPAPISGLSWWSPTITLIGLPKTVPPKSSTAICAAVTEPWPVGVEAGPFMSVSTPILTTSSETWASAAVEASTATASAASLSKCLLSILSPPVAFDAAAVCRARDRSARPNWFLLQPVSGPRQSRSAATKVLCGLGLKPRWFLSAFRNNRDWRIGEASLLAKAAAHRKIGLVRPHPARPVVRLPRHLRQYWR